MYGASPERRTQMKRWERRASTDWLCRCTRDFCAKNFKAARMLGKAYQSMYPTSHLQSSNSRSLPISWLKNVPASWLLSIQPTLSEKQALRTKISLTQDPYGSVERLSRSLAITSYVVSYCRSQDLAIERLDLYWAIPTQSSNGME